jgi:hypothetical protein
LSPLSFIQVILSSPFEMAAPIAGINGGREGNCGEAPLSRASETFDEVSKLSPYPYIRKGPMPNLALVTFI